MTSRLRISVLISGGGTTLKNLIDRNGAGGLALDFGVVISSNRAAVGLDYARAAQIPCHVVERSAHATPESHADAVFALCRYAKVDLVVMAGFLSHVLIPQDFAFRVVNIHPSLIPAFCGKGYYGIRVHQAVLSSGAKITGCTVHYVDNLYDHGPIILQRAVPVREDDTAHTLAQRVFEAECEAYPEALRMLSRGETELKLG